MDKKYYVFVQIKIINLKENLKIKAKKQFN